MHNPPTPSQEFMLITFLVLFVISLPILVYHKYCTVLDVWEKPPAFQNPLLRMAYGLVRLVIGVGSVVGIWYFGGIIAGVIAAVIYLLLGTVTLRMFYQNQLLKWISTFEKTIRKED